MENRRGRENWQLLALQSSILDLPSSTHSGRIHAREPQTASAVWTI